MCSPTGFSENVFRPRPFLAKIADDRVGRPYCDGFITVAAGARSFAGCAKRRGRKSFAGIVGRWRAQVRGMFRVVSAALLSRSRHPPPVSFSSNPYRYKIPLKKYKGVAEWHEPKRVRPIIERIYRIRFFEVPSRSVSICVDAATVFSLLPRNRYDREQAAAFLLGAGPP